MRLVSGLIFVTFAAVITLGSASMAAELPARLATVQDASCVQVAKDRFDLGWRMSADSKGFAGKCVDTRSKRPVKVLSETKDVLTFANFFHRGEFWIAEWSKADRPRVDFLLVHFDSGIPLITMGHTEIRFRFTNGLRLTSQISGKRAVVRDVIMDWEATFVEGQGYDPLVGFVDNYALTGRLLSTEARIQENIVAPGVMRRIDQYKMNMSSSLATVLFWEFVQRSNLRSTDYFYLTIKRNCTTELFAIIDPVLKRANMISEDFAPFQTIVMLDPIIGPTYRGLVARGLVTRNQPRTSFSAEFGYQEER